MSFNQLQSASKLQPQVAYWWAGYLTLGLLAVLVKVGALGILAAVALLAVILLMPLLMDRYGLFLFVWLFIVPAFDNMRTLLVAGTNPVVFLITGLTLPFAVWLVGRDVGKVVRALPFAGYLALFNGILFLNIFRPDAEPGVPLECLKLFFELFVLCCGYRVLVQGNRERLFNQVNGFMIFNSGVAFFQRLTGIGLTVIEGVPRVGGLVGHPNCLAFLNVLFIPFGIARLLRANTGRQRAFWLLGVATATLALLLTFCKNVIFCMVLDYAVLFLFLPAALKRRCVYALAFMLLALVAANAVFDLNLVTLLFDRLANNDSMAWRLKIWRELLGNAEGISLLVGHGVNSGKALVHQVVPGDSTFIHNIYIQLLYEYGVTGLTLIAAFLQPTVSFLRALIKAKHPAERLDAVLPLLILLTIFLNMATDNSVFLRTPMGFAWLFLAYFYMKNSQQFPAKPEAESSD
jgi:O-antigen ligase